MSKIKSFNIPVSKEEFLSKYLKIVNFVFNLTPREFTILKELIEIDPKEITTASKKLLNVKNRYIINNTIKTLKDKGIIKKIPNSTRYTYHPIVQINSTIDKIIINFDYE